MKISGIILSGGEGQRTGGADKGLLPYAPQNENGGGAMTLVEAVFKSFRPQVDELVLSANRNLEHYRRLGVPVYKDTLPPYQGPLAGIHAALAGCQHPIIAVVPCDGPEIPEDLVLRLAAALLAENSELSYAQDGVRPQFLFTVFRKTCRESLEHYLAGGGRSVRGWYAGLRCSEVRFGEKAGGFPNLNTE